MVFLFGLFHELLDAVQVIHQLRDGADCFALVDGEVGFMDVRHCPFHVGTGAAAKTMRMQTTAQGGLGRLELAQQRLPLLFN